MKRTAHAVILLFCLSALSTQGRGGGESYWELALSCDRAGDWAGAMANYEKAIGANMKAGAAIPPYWHSSAGWTALGKLDDPERALPHFLAVQEGNYPLASKDSSLQGIVTISYRLGRWDDFMKYALLYEELGTNPERHRTVNDLLANRYMVLGEAERALFHARRVGDDFWISRLLRPRVVDLSFSFRFRELVELYHPRLKGESTLLVEIPLDTYYQELLSVTSDPPFTRLIRKDRMNWLEFDFSRGLPAILKLDCSVRVDIVNRDPLGARSYPEASGPIAAYAHDDSRRHELDYDLDDPLLIQTVKDITAGKDSMFDKLKSLSGWLDAEVLHPETLDARGVTGYPDISRYTRISDVLSNRLGDCVQRPGLFTAMCRVLGVPARILLVFVYLDYWDKPEGLFDGAHGLPEVYDPSQDDWIQTDIVPAARRWYNHHYSIACEYYSTEEKPPNLLNLMFLTQDAIRMGDAEAGRWKLHYVE